MKEAYLYEKRGDGAVQCKLCGHGCTVAPGERGICQVRENRSGVLYSLVYDKVVSRAVDPIEKKPLFHLMPGSRCYSLATVGCNFTCSFCQNWDLSQHPRLADGGGDLPGHPVPPKDLVADALGRGCHSMAFTYGEPTVFFELCLDTAILARRQGIATVLVTNGFMTPEATAMIAPHLTAANVDLKSGSDAWYRRVCGGRLKPVKDTVAALHQAGVLVEVTTLLIPGENDAESELADIAEFLAGIDPLIPWHLSAFHPDYRMQDRPRTPAAALEKAVAVGQQAGLSYIYTGNLFGRGREDSRCHHCGGELVVRQGYTVTRNLLRGSACPHCGQAVPFVA